MKKYVLFLIITAMMTGCRTQIKPQPYPETRRDTTIIENYFGTIVPDPYRWLEDDRSDETAAWVRAQNLVTDDYLSQIPYREVVRQRLSELYNYPRYGAPTKKGDYYFFFKNDGLQDQSILYYQKDLDDEPQVFLDPNKLSDDGTVALSVISFSKDNRYLAYSVSASGSDWNEIYVIDIETRETLPDHIRWVKFSGAQWSADGFYYSRYDAPAEGSEYSGANEYQKIYFHRLGTPQTADELIHYDSEHPLRYFRPVVSKCDRWLFVNASEGTSGSEILCRRTDSNEGFRTLLSGFENDYHIVWCEEDRMLVYTNDGASKFRLVELNPSEENIELLDLIAEEDELLEGVTVGGGFIFATYLRDASSRVVQYDMEGNRIREIELPGIGTVSGFSGEREDTTLFYTFSSFNYPPTIFTLVPQTGISEVFRKTETSFDPEDFVVDQQFYPSKDGIRVPMFLVYKKGMKRNGKNPVHMSAYGGFNISSTPAFSPSIIMFLEQGGIYALPNLRGGGEYGEEWHRAGMLENKQNVFDDFIAAAEYLIKERYTSAPKLAISGGSNGGLLIGACMTQRPDLFAVTFPRVGVLDMLRYHKFTIGWGWVVEYGSSDEERQFEYLYKYSPLHNLREKTCYPPTMVMTADHDDRVVPAHSFKFAARLQEVQSCVNPVLIRIESNAGHGAGKPLSKQIDEMADLYSFLFWNTNAKVDLK